MVGRFASSGRQCTDCANIILSIICKYQDLIREVFRERLLQIGFQPLRGRKAGGYNGNTSTQILESLERKRGTVKFVIPVWGYAHVNGCQFGCYFSLRNRADVANCRLTRELFEAVRLP